MKNRFIENYDKISKISIKNSVDIGVACAMYVHETKMTDWNDEKEKFDIAYFKWLQADFAGDIAQYA